MQFKNIREFHDLINQLFHFSLAIPLLPAVFIFLETNHNNMQPAMRDNYMVLIVTLSSSIIIAALAFKRYRSSLGIIRDEPTLSDQFESLFREYRRLYFASLLASIILVAGYYLTASPYLIGMYLILLFSLSLLRPYYGNYNRDLMLDDDTAKAVRKMTLQFQDEPDQK